MSSPTNIKTFAANPRSRASKRATSPSIDLDKSLKAAPRNDSLSQPVLAPRPGAGIAKKKSKRGNAKTRGQKVRQEKGLQRAEAVMDQMQKKVEWAKEREGKRRERRKVWEEVNSGVNGVRKKGEGNVGGMVGGEDWEDVEDGNGDGDKEMEGVDGTEAPAEGAVGAVKSTAPAELGPGEGKKLLAVDHTVTLNGIEFEDEIT
jgi:hypothetical protein